MLTICKGNVTTLLLFMKTRNVVSYVKRKLLFPVVLKTFSFKF